MEDKRIAMRGNLVDLVIGIMNERHALAIVLEIS